MWIIYLTWCAFCYLFTLMNVFFIEVYWNYIDIILLNMIKRRSQHKIGLYFHPFARSKEETLSLRCPTVFFIIFV